jgi:hypothetical protein
MNQCNQAKMKLVRLKKKKRFQIMFQNKYLNLLSTHTTKLMTRRWKKPR